MPIKNKRRKKILKNINILTKKNENKKKGGNRCLMIEKNGIVNIKKN